MPGRAASEATATRKESGPIRSGVGQQNGELHSSLISSDWVTGSPSVHHECPQRSPEEAGHAHEVSQGAAGQRTATMGTWCRDSGRGVAIHLRKEAEVRHHQNRRVAVGPM